MNNWEKRCDNNSVDFFSIKFMISNFFFFNKMCHLGIIQFHLHFKEHKIVESDPAVPGWAEANFLWGL